jgi:hypothetical protein
MPEPGMRMKKYLLLLPVLLCLSACAQPLPSSAFAPANQDFYKDLPQDYYLKGKLAVGQVTNSYSPKDIITGPAYGEAIATIFGNAGLIASGRPSYTLNAEIVDYRWPSSGFMHVTGGSAVKYSLVDSSGREVFAKTVTSTQEIKKGIFEDTAPVMIHSLAMSLGENAAQAVREFAALRKQDVNGRKK